MKILRVSFSVIFTLSLATTIYAQLAVDPIALDSAASGTLRNGLAPELIASFVSHPSLNRPIAPGTAVASGSELPTELLGVRVEITDGAKVTRLAQLFSVSPTRIDFLVPINASAGKARLRVYNGDRFIGDQQVLVNSAEVGLFTADRTGQGAASGTVLRIKANGEQSYEPLSRFDAATNTFVPVPIDLGAENDQVYLILYGTGMRQLIDSPPFRPHLFFGGVTIGGEGGGLLVYIGPQGTPGLDQINVRVPRSLAGKGEVDLQLNVFHRLSNVVKVAFK
jgi:uncharacterized protein (TIGR03437 family)